MKVLGSILLAAITAATGAAQGFTPAGDLADARLAHTATLLQDGRAANPPRNFELNILSSTELYTE